MILGSDSPGSLATSTLEKPRSVCDGLGDLHPVRLFVETLAVTILAIGAVRWLHVQQVLHPQWLLIPVVLILSAVLPIWLGGRDFPRIGLSVDSARSMLIPLGWVCGCMLPAMITGLWLIRSLHLPIPLAPAVGPRSDWLGWLLYQFLYVAVAEEVFFRGYVQSNVMRLCRRAPWGQSVQFAVTLIVSAGCFAIAHAAVQNSALPLLTFFPGLLMAWLFLRTGSLMAPILFHGLANTAYGIAAAVLS
jgi:membrane protease YdiL (CAAX protease family)